MREYEICVLDDQANVLKYFHEIHLSDQSAIAAARRRSKTHAFQVWSGDHCVAKRQGSYENVITGPFWVERADQTQSIKTLGALTSFIDTLPVALMLVDGSGKVLSHNGAMERVVGNVIPSKDKRQLSSWHFAEKDGSAVSPQHWPSQRALRGETEIRGFDCIHNGPLYGERNLRVTAMPANDGQSFRGGAVLIQDLGPVWCEREGPGRIRAKICGIGVRLYQQSPALIAPGSYRP